MKKLVIIIVFVLCLIPVQSVYASGFGGGNRGGSWGTGGFNSNSQNTEVSYQTLSGLCAQLDSEIANGLWSNVYPFSVDSTLSPTLYSTTSDGNLIYYIRVKYVSSGGSTSYYYYLNNNGQRYYAYADKSNPGTLKQIATDIETIKNMCVDIRSYLITISTNLNNYISGIPNYISNAATQLNKLTGIETNTSYIDDIYNVVNSNNIWVTNQTAYSDDTTSNPHKYPYLDLKWEAVNNMVAEMNSHYLGKPIKALHQDNDNTVAASSWIFAGAYIDGFNVLRIRYELSSGTNGNGYAVTPQHYLIRAFDASNIYATNTTSVLNNAQEWEIDYQLGLSIIDAINNGDGYVYFMGSSSGVFTPSRIAIVGNPYINESRRIQIRGRNTDNTGLSTYTVIMPDLRLPVIKQNPVDSILTAINNLDVSIQQTNFYPTVVTFMTEINANIDSIFDTLDAKFDVSIGSLVDSIDADFDDLIDTIDHQNYGDPSSLIPYIDQLETYTDNIESYLQSIKANTYTTINSTQYSVADLLAVADQGITSINNALVWGSGNDAMSISQINKAILDWLDDDSLQNDIHIVGLLNTWEDELQYGINNSSQILNLFNTAYSDMLLPPQPGTWANAGSYFTMLYRGDQ